jgi:hypothetical protein
VTSSSGGLQVDRDVEECRCPSIFFTMAVDARSQPRAPASLPLGRVPLNILGAFS